METKFLKLITLVFFIILTSCEDDNDNKLIGMWIEKQPYNDGVLDTIAFNSNGVIEYYFPLEGYFYELVGPDSVKIFTSEFSYTFQFYIDNTNELLLSNFIDRSISHQQKTIVFIKD